MTKAALGIPREKSELKWHTCACSSVLLNLKIEGEIRVSLFCFQPIYYGKLAR